MRVQPRRSVDEEVIHGTSGRKIDRDRPVPARSFPQGMNKEFHPLNDPTTATCRALGTSVPGNRKTTGAIMFM